MSAGYGGGEGPPRDPDKENAMLSHILAALLATPSPDLAELAAELDSEGVGRKLTVDVVERVLMAKLSAKKICAERLKYLFECDKRSQEEFTYIEEIDDVVSLLRRVPLPDN
eukprot:TRINITY_DN8662_c0_g1_i1.p1 TRINITY_DN8662_c0_g1~~TRINITY_DN8662_c0_g1_i1.p1  ORF type:complete len:112 (+),score=20.75 TRINITY_DN8662_c0_g1_i1:62-397(+)